MRRITVWLLALTLTFAGLALFWYKVDSLEFPLTPSDEYDSWYVEARLAFRPDRSLRTEEDSWDARPVRLSLHLPEAPHELAMVDEQFVAEGFGLTTSTQDDGDRLVTFTKRKGERRELIYYRAILYHLDSPAPQKKDKNKPKVSSPYSKKSRPDRVEAEEEPLFLAVDSLIEQAKDESADKRSFIKALAKLAAEPDDRHRLIMAEASAAKSPTALTVLLLKAANIPARLVHGLSLDSARQHIRKFDQWAEVWYRNRWRPINPENYDLFFTDSHLRWWIGHEAPFELQGGRKAELDISVKRNTDNALTRALWKSGTEADWLSRFSLFTLPINTQLIFEVMLLIPVGGLVISFLRQVIGLRTFGTFMPVLIALSFRETGLAAGLITFTMIVILGLIIRSWFHRLQLLVVPRLTAVLTIVVMLIVVLALIAQNAGFSLGLSLSLFPIVILTMTIERMALMWDESSPKEATMIGLGSLLAAAIGFAAMNDPLVLHLLFTFPELLLVILAFSLLLGRYNGYKLSEYWRFRQLARDIENKQKGQ